MTVNELKNIVNSIIICLTASNTLTNSLKYSIECIENERFKKSYERFVTDYELYGHNLKIASKNLCDCFNIHEIKLFLNSLFQSEKDGNIIGCLEKFELVLDINYAKYLKKNSSKIMLYVTFATIASLINIIAIVTYPIMFQVFENVQTIFN